MFKMTWGIRRIMFTIGAMLLVGGWGLTGYVDAYQYAAGSAAGDLWRDGQQATTATMRRSAPARTETPVAGPVAGTEAAPTRIEPRPRMPKPIGLELTRQITPPSSWLYALGVVIMMGGAGLMALMVPWRGARMAAAAEAAPHQHYIAPAPPMASKPEKAPKAKKAKKAKKGSLIQPPAAPAFPGVPPLQDAQSMASAPMQSPMQEPMQEPGGKTGMKPLQYKKGA